MKFPTSPLPFAIALAAVVLCGTARAGDAEEVRIGLTAERRPVGATRLRPVVLDVDDAGRLRGKIALPVLDDAGRGREALVHVVGDARDERVRIDTDLDGDLSDERELRWTRHGLRSRVAVTVELTREGAEPVSVGVMLVRSPFSAKPTVRVRVGHHRWGAARVGGSLRLVALEDGDGDLRFDGPSDRLYVDVAGDGELDTRPGSGEEFTPGRPFRLAGREWVATVSDPGGAGVVFRSESGPPAARPAPDAPSAQLGEVVGRIDAAELSLDEQVDAVRALGAYRTRDATGLAVLIARSRRDARLRIAALDALENADYASREALFGELLRDIDRQVAAAAAQRLCESGALTARGAVARAVGGLSSRGARLAVYRGARRAAGGPPVQATLAAAVDTHPPLQALALEDLWRARHLRARALALSASELPVHDPELARVLPPIFASFGDAECVDELVVLARDQEIREDVLDAFSVMRDGPGVARVIHWLEAESPVDRLIASEVLAHSPSPRAAAALLERLTQEKDSTVRAAVLDALGVRGEVRAVDALARLAEGESRGLRRFAFEALGTTALRGFGDVRQFLATQLRSELRGNRVLAAQAAVASGDLALVTALRGALSDEYRKTRAAAAEALGRLRHRDSVRPLVERLGREQNPRVRDSVAVALFRLTGVNLYDDVELWKRWVQENGETFGVPEVVPELKAGVGKTAAKPPPKFYGIALDTDGVVFVIDQSGSMAGNDSRIGFAKNRAKSKFDVAVSELLKAVDALHDGAGVGLVLFDHRVRTWSRSLQPASARLRKVLREHLEAEQPSGETNLYDALHKALLIDDVETVVLLSDGAPTAGRYTDEHTILRAIAQLNAKRDITIHCVSVGQHSSLLRALARQSGGTYARR